MLANSAKKITSADPSDLLGSNMAETLLETIQKRRKTFVCVRGLINRALGSRPDKHVLEN